ncbi:MAG: stage 0 sporulation family protein [Spirochaetales bacterium]
MERKVVGVKFKPVGKIYYFDANNLELKDGDGVIVETEVGQEYGEVVYAEKLVDASTLQSELKPIMRKAVDKDYDTLEKNSKRAVECSKVAAELIKKLNLDMKLIDVELTFDASKIIFTFTADERVDFRELVKELANKLHSRIELRQVGARDVSKIVGGIGPCGRVVCCANHMREFNKVSIKMAKTQGLALNPTKINGLCGRLMCCLAYEDEYYSEISKKMPKVGRTVTTPDGEGVVVYNNLLKNLVTVRFSTPDGTATTTEYPLSDIKRNNVEEKEEENPNCKNCPKKQSAEPNDEVDELVEEEVIVLIESEEE